MAVLAGIDEAGYGPVLGPLVVSGVAFRVPDDRLDDSLWSILRESCAQRPSKKERRIVVADSKKMYRKRQSLTMLERTASVMSAVAGDRPQTFRQWLGCVAPGAADVLSTYPWYTDVDYSLPIDEAVGDIATRAVAVARDCKRTGTEFLGITSEPLAAGEFNRQVRGTRNKAVVLTCLALRVVDRIIRSASSERIRLVVDRLGGRTHYRRPIQDAFPTYDLRILEESANRCTYRLTRPPRECVLEFVTKGDDRHFPVALASVCSKYLRELYMKLFNDYWCGKVAGLKPTAGYYADAQRWLRDAEPAVHRLRVDRELLVRRR